MIETLITVMINFGFFIFLVYYVNTVYLQEVFLTIRRQKTTIFTDLKESNTIQELKKVIQGILKIAPEDQVLYDGTTDQVSTVIFR